VPTYASGGFLDHYLPYLLREADQTLSEPFYGLLAEHKIARSEWRVLAVLHERGPLPVADLAQAALSPQPTVTHAVRRLTERELVSSARGEADKRQRIVSVSTTGALLTQRLIDGASELEGELLAGVDELPQLRRQLSELTALLRQRLDSRAAPATDQLDSHRGEGVQR
jgi:DNA-binding MarR family transcriptional regulator